MRSFDQGLLQRLHFCRVALLLLLPILVALPATQPVAAAVCAGSFGFAPTTLSSTNPSSITVGDVNNDGRPDLVLGNANGVSVHLASGTPGQFALPVTYATDNGPAFVAIGDLNMDGRLDIAVANSGSSTVSILFGSGSPGSFAAPLNYATGNNPRSVAIGDLNGDGRLDLAIANSCSVSVLLASGSPGSFSPRVDYSALCSPVSVAIGDLNGDGRPDMAAAKNGSHRVSVFLASGAPGTFAPEAEYVTGVSPAAVVIGDLNDDGRLDLVAANNVSGTVSIFLASGATGNFAAGVEYPAGSYPRSMAIGDLNGDGRLDLATTNESTNTVSVLLGNGDGSFAAPLQYAVGSVPQAAVMADLNGDGRLDIAVANYASGAVSVLLNQPTPTTFVVSTPSGATTGSPFAITATVRDACGNIATGFSGPVTLAIKPGTGAAGAALGGTATVGAVNGVASFSGLSLDKRAAGYVLIASAAGVAPGESAIFVVGNAPPVAYDDSFSTYEDTPLPPSADALANDFDADGDALTGSLISGPAHGTNGAAYVPAANYNGPDSLIYRAYDGAAFSNVASINITVHPVNDAPFFTKGANQSVAEDVGTQSVSGWASGIGTGPANENDQTLSFLVTNDNNALFAAQPAITLDGTLNYTPAPDANGSATVTAQAQDDGGTANGGADTSAAQTFTITITPVNDAPTLDPIGDQSVLENAAVQTVNLSGIGVGPANESGQTLTVTATSDNPTLIPNPTIVYSSADTIGTLSFTPAANAVGSAIITVRVSDSGGGAPNANSFERSFAVFIGPVNHRPSLDQPASLALPEDAGARQVALSGIGAGEANEIGQTLTVTATSDKPALIPNPTVSYSSPSSAATLNFTPVANASGTATITVRVSDDGGTANGGMDIVERTFVVQVAPVNDAPDFAAGPNQVANATDGAQIVAGWASGFTPGPQDEASQTLISYTVVSNSHAGLFAVAPAIDRFGTLAYTPAPGTGGTALMGVTVRDNGGTANGGVDTSVVKTFVITVESGYRVYVPLMVR
jgi:hypothetical protein